MVTIVKTGQYAENVYFEKLCRLMNQCVCLVGCLISIDFQSLSSAKVQHSLCIVDMKGLYAHLTDEYHVIP